MIFPAVLLFDQATYSRSVLALHHEQIPTVKPDFFVYISQLDMGKFLAVGTHLVLTLYHEKTLLVQNSFSLKRRSDI